METPPVVHAIPSQPQWLLFRPTSRQHMLKVLPRKPSVASRRHPLSLLRHLWTLRQRPLVWPQLRRACQAGLSCRRDNYPNVYSLSLFIKIDIAFQYLQVISFINQQFWRWCYTWNKNDHMCCQNIIVKLCSHYWLGFFIGSFHVTWFYGHWSFHIHCCGHHIRWWIAYIYWICFFSVCMYECCSEQHNCYFPLNYQCIINVHSLNIVMDKQFSNSHLGINLNDFSNKLIYPESFFEVYLHDSFPFWSLY